MSRLLATLAALVLSSPVLAATATVTSATEGVLVNQGEQFVGAQIGQALATGDRVMVPAGGSSTLTFEDGCAIRVQPETLITVPEQSPCAGGKIVTQRITPPAGSTASAAGPTGANAAADSWVGWAYVGSVVAITAVKTTEGDNDTASP